MKLIRRLLTKWKNLKTNLNKDSNWVTIYQSIDEPSVRIYSMQLEDNEIASMIFDQRDSSYNAFGYLYLQVRVEDKSKALELLNLDHE